MVKDVLSKFEPRRENLLDILHAVQETSPNNSLSSEDIEMIAKYVGITPAEVYGTATFYTMFSVKPRGKHVIRVCVSPACHLLGGESILEALKEELGVDVGDTTKDGLFTLEISSCLGICGVAPAMMIDEIAYGNLTPARVRDIINEYRRGG
ncbi:MAG: NADH-quinone oxidoreductase subunit NuoE [Synergistetes bacterium]|nr:NADH-quinone oxidoreductase subunit NuoE [Synergistota bacterium]MCX8128158.1 NADH-quinone oxidoreductase subunit NuoE [Synergistota bacterium]MDW8192534.1 NADH-quinone oxidoreductase subunit NuoE [Synergistota bacterium]